MALIIPGYVVKNLIQEGGFSGVYLAVRVQDKKAVAIKILTPKANEKNSNKKMLYREVKLLQKMNHPNIIKVDGLIKDSPRPAMVMDFFEGETLKALYKNKYAVIEKYGVGIFRKTLKAVKYMHDMKIIHKDIKPENILASETGDVRIIDLSIAEKPSFLSKLLKRKREGTPLYMSPEQVLRRPLDVRSDIYALGATFFEVFTGTTHIIGTSEKDILTKQIKGTVPKMRKYNKNVPYQIESIILRMLEKKVSARYQSISEILFDLNKFGSHDFLISKK